MLIYDIILLSLFGIGFALGAAVFCKPEARWWWVGSILSATVAIFGGLIIGLVALILQTGLIPDNPISSSQWVLYISRSVAAALLLVSPFVVSSWYFGKKARGSKK